MVGWEHIALSFCAYLTIVAFLTRAPRVARIASLASLVIVGALAAFLPTPDQSAVGNQVRTWLPLAVLLAGYRVSGFFFVAPMDRLELALSRLDERVLGSAAGTTTRLIERLPASLLDLLELSYLLVYPTIPAGVAVVLLVGDHGDVETFWLVVMTSAFASYAFLPWLQTRPPRLVEQTRVQPPSALRRLNLTILRAGSTHVNTIPSGHAAAASAVALAVMSVTPTIGALLILLALAIAVATIVGRYHYCVDTLAGVVVAVLAWLAMG